MLKGFKQFIMRGNSVDLAVGVVVGAAFGAVVTSLVTNLMTPIIGAIFKSPDFSGLYFVINGSKFMYGNFLNSLITFVVVAFSIYFFVVLPINTLKSHTQKKDAPLDPTTKKCPECLSEIPIEATRCAFCTTKIS
jgi:large conductance mechanosensitive channel